MDTHVVFDCQKVLPNRFALTLAAASRIRALARGAEPRLDAVDRTVGDLPCTRSRRARSRWMNSHRFCLERMKGVFCLRAIRLPSFAMAEAEAPPHPPPVRERRFVEEASKPTRRNERC